MEAELTAEELGEELGINIPGKLFGRKTALDMSYTATEDELVFTSYSLMKM